MKNHAATTAGWLAIAALSCVASLGCGKSQAQMGPPQPGAPEVQVSLPVSATVTEGLVAATDTLSMSTLNAVEEPESLEPSSLVAVTVMV